MKVSEDIKSALQNLSTEPGVITYDAKEALLYVGKLKTLNAGCRLISIANTTVSKQLIWYAK